ncbi:MAG: hypothetical protein R3321_03015 [Nitrososphaeraceae archaeon]|nr:hypothetical protein [Nitrososphaeraceae archaeon]
MAKLIDKDGVKLVEVEDVKKYLYRKKDLEFAKAKKEAEILELNTLLALYDE